MHIGFVLLNCDLGAEEYILEELEQVNEIKMHMLHLAHMTS